MLTKNYLAIYAKSFNWAGFFLPKKTYEKCSALYDFCREADNIADDENKIEVKKDNFIKFKKQFFSQISKNYSIETLTLNAIEKDQIDSKFLNNLLLLYERESFIMAFNKISYLSFYTSLVPLILLLTIAIKKNYPTKGTS